MNPLTAILMAIALLASASTETQTLAITKHRDGTRVQWMEQVSDEQYNGAQPIDQFAFRDRDGQYYLIYGGWRHCGWPEWAAPRPSVVTSDEVASHELLLATVPASVLRSFRERLLGPLLAYDDQHRAELLPTLREFLACSGSWNACAARMYVHVNTVRYRIRRIEELTGRDLSRLDDQVDFFLALRIR